MSAVDRYKKNKRLSRRLKRVLPDADLKTVMGIYMMLIPTYKIN